LTRRTFHIDTHRGLAIQLCFLLLAGVASGQAASEVYQVADVIDGDTFRLSNGEKVRLIGIDAPESHYSYKLIRDVEEQGADAETIRALGALSARYLESIAAGRDVVLAFDQANSATGHRDRFGRLLAYVSLSDASGAPLVCINDMLLDAGYANVYSRYPFDRVDWYRSAEAAAREAQRGLWAPDALNTPESYALTHVEEPLFVTRTGTHYHRANCRSLRLSKVRLEDRHDPDRYEACRICKPGPKPVAAHVALSTSE
jgi:micrococcal nuclease